MVATCPDLAQGREITISCLVETRVGLAEDGRSPSTRHSIDHSTRDLTPRSWVHPRRVGSPATKVGGSSDRKAFGWHLDRAWGRGAVGLRPKVQRFVFADGSRRDRGLNIFPGAPASHRPRCVMLKMGAAAAACGWNIFPGSPASHRPRRVLLTRPRITSLGCQWSLVRTTSGFRASQAGYNSSSRRGIHPVSCSP